MPFSILKRTYQKLIHAKNFLPSIQKLDVSISFQFLRSDLGHNISKLLIQLEGMLKNQNHLHESTHNS